MVIMAPEHVGSKTNVAVRYFLMYSLIMKKQKINLLVMKIRSSLDELEKEINEIDNKQQDNEIQQSFIEPTISDFIEMADTILQNTRNSAQYSFVSGIKSFAESNGFLTKGQVSALVSTYKTFQVPLNLNKTQTL